ncbi:NosD domain-containing protein [Methanosarcina hadiensis]|uniref:NosD domain-containing protein n=1 Tax=Methanosarcina hadiensis TaxID=3078083 RepID=UPI003977B566
MISVFLSGAMFSCFSELKRVSAAESILAGNDGGNSSKNSSIILTGAGDQVPGLSEKPLNPGYEKLSRDLLQLCDGRYLSEEESSATLRARMVKLGQLSQEDPVLRKAASPVEGPENPAGSGMNASKSSFLPAEKVYVYIYLEPLSDSSILDGYCEVIEKDEENHIAVAWVPLESLESLASLPEVRDIQTVLPPFVRQGNTVSEGDFILKSSRLRESYGVNGTGIKIGIISDGVDRLEDTQATGDVSYGVYILSNRMEGSEGTAMLEIVQDIAPGAELYFHDCGSSRLEFNRAVDALVSEGCIIICDDIGWLSEPFFEDGIVADHVKEVIRDHDILYISSAGNSGDSHYQGAFYDNGSGWHDFSSGKKEVTDLQLEIQPSGEAWVFLQWNDRWEQSGNNYDLYLMNKETSETIASSKVFQDGDNLPLEYIMYANEGNSTINASIEIKKVSGETKELELYIYYWPGVTVSPENIIAKDSIFGHPALPEVVTVGAVGNGVSGNYKIESFSSVGPATIYYPFPEVRPKADISGPDGVSITGVDGISERFYGTSASSPHVAAIAALVWSDFPEKSAMDIKRLLYTSSTDIGEPGYDTIFGYGLVDASRMHEKASEAPSILTVKTDGSGDFSSISEAINNSKPGDSILAYPGAYRENIDVPWSLNLSSASGKPWDTVLEAENSEKAVFHVTANSVNISGFGINGSARAGIYLESADGCRFTNNKISGCAQGILLENSFNNTLAGNNISNNTEGLRLTDSFLNTIFENEFDNSINVNENSSQDSSSGSGLSNAWNTTSDASYLYNSGIYRSRFGNFYSNYQGSDADRNGIGDLPYGSDSFPLIARFAAYSTGFEIGNITPSRDPALTDVDTVEFAVRSTGNCTFSWLINGILLQKNESVSFAVLSIDTGKLMDSINEISNDAPLKGEYNLTVIAANNSSTLQHSWNLTVSPAEKRTDASESISEDSIVRSSSSEVESKKSLRDRESGGSDGTAISPVSLGNIENIENKELAQRGPLRFSSQTTSEKNSPETGPDGAPEVWVIRENESNSPEASRENERNIPFFSFGMCIIILLTVDLWIKRK